VSETKHISMGPKQQAELDKILRGIAKERKVAVEADLDSRLSYREKDPNKPKQASWAAYSRFLLSDGHTVYVALRTMKASVSKDVDKWAQSKVEKRLARQKRTAERKAKAAAKKTVKAAEPSKAEPKPATVKVKATTKKVPVVKFDKDLPTLEGTSMRQVKK
jgi:uncharacterized protein YdaU (DUF1376 family)